MSSNLRNLLDTFLYGCRIMHAQSKHNAEKEIASLFATHGKENVLLEIHWGFRTLAYIADQTARVISQDFREWMVSGRHVGPTITPVAELMQSWRNF